MLSIHLKLNLVRCNDWHLPELKALDSQGSLEALIDEQ